MKSIWLVFESSNFVLKINKSQGTSIHKMFQFMLEMLPFDSSTFCYFFRWIFHFPWPLPCLGFSLNPIPYIVTLFSFHSNKGISLSFLSKVKVKVMTTLKSIHFYIYKPSLMSLWHSQDNMIFLQKKIQI
jgi:hypothetical protein